MLNRLYWWPRPGWLLAGTWITLVSLPAFASDEPPAIENAGKAIASDKRTVPVEHPKTDPLFPGMPYPGHAAIKFVPEGASSSPVANDGKNPTALNVLAGQSSKPTLGQSPLPKGTPAETAGDDTAPKPEEKPLEPIPDPQTSQPTKIETASFNGVTPGITVRTVLQEAWGPPRQISKEAGMIVHLYKVEPFTRVEVSFVDETAMSVVIRLDEAVPTKHLTQLLKLGNIRPVLVSNDLGEILGQTFPERGVLFAFEPAEVPGKTSTKVVQIIIEPVSAEAFVLRAETFLDTELAASLRDLENAVKLQPENARAHWLRARALMTLGDNVSALAPAKEAVRLEPANAWYQVTLADLLGKLDQIEEGMVQALSALDNSERRPHVMARALCLLGDLTSAGPNPDYPRAIEYHTQAIKTADPLAVNRHPAIRLAAKEVLIDAHLGAAHDIAWGNWNEQSLAVTRWLDRASAFAEEYVENDGGSVEHRFRVAHRALAASIGLAGDLDPTEWADAALGSGQELIASITNDTQKQRTQWQLGVALYDAVQVYQLRSEHDLAFRYGQKSVKYLEQGIIGTTDPAEHYLLGRLYFRLGAIQAVGEGNHKIAINWFDKAGALFEQVADQIAPQEAGRLGDTFISMSVSYWEVGQHQRALDLTGRGADLIKFGVNNGSLERSALEVPYGNLAVMHRRLGQDREADKYHQEALRAKQTIKR
jgi:tetratricopeptide (TPR) repeat protein